MSGLSPLRITLISSRLPEPRGDARQVTENPGFKSLLLTATTALPQAVSSPAAPIDPHQAAQTASEKAAVTTALPAEQPSEAERRSPHVSDLRRSSIDLLPILSREDATELEALAANGRMTWPEIHAALEAKIKLRAAEELLQDRQRLERKPQSWIEAENARGAAWEKYKTWSNAYTEGEADIRERYNEKASGLFAEDPGVGPAALEKLLAQVRMMDDIDKAMKDELAELDRKLGPEPPMPSFAMRLPPWNTAFAWSRLTSTEAEALDKLDATGFKGSSDMDATISNLVGEITGHIVAWYEREQQASPT